MQDVSSNEGITVTITITAAMTVTVTVTVTITVVITVTITITATITVTTTVKGAYNATSSSWGFPAAAPSSLIATYDRGFVVQQRKEQPDSMHM